MDDAVPPATANAPDVLASELAALDDQVLALVARRLKLAERLDGPPLQPGAEIKLIRKLVGSGREVEPELVVEVWRALIAAGARRKRVIDVALGGSRGDPTRLFDIARRHFGARTRIAHYGEPQVALMRAMENPETCVAVTPWPGAPNVGAWWPALSESRFAGLHLIAGLPVLGAPEETPEACVFSALPTEAAGGDVSLLLMDDPHHRAQRALGEAGLEGREVARSEPRALIRVAGFVALDDPRTRAMGGLVDRVRVLGSYARV